MTAVQRCAQGYRSLPLVLLSNSHSVLCREPSHDTASSSRLAVSVSTVQSGPELSYQSGAPSVQKRWGSASHTYDTHTASVHWSVGRQLTNHTQQDPDATSYKHCWDAKPVTTTHSSSGLCLEQPLQPVQLHERHGNVNNAQHTPPVLHSLKCAAQPSHASQLPHLGSIINAQHTLPASHSWQHPPMIQHARHRDAEILELLSGPSGHLHSADSEHSRLHTTSSVQPVHSGIQYNVCPFCRLLHSRTVKGLPCIAQPLS